MKYEDYDPRNPGSKLLDGAGIMIGEELTESKWLKTALAIDELVQKLQPKPKFDIGEVVVDIRTVRKIASRHLGKSLDGSPAWYYAFDNVASVRSHENLLKPLPNKGEGYL